MLVGDLVGVDKAKSVGENLHRGLSLYAEVKENSAGLSHTDATYQAKVQHAVGLFVGLESIIEKSFLFSENEGIKEVSTHALPLLLVDAILGDLFLLLERTGADPSKSRTALRLETLRVVGEYYLAFFRRLNSYKLLAQDDIKYLEVHVLGRALSETDDGTVSVKGVGRDERIARYKREREMKAQLAVLQQKLGIASSDDSGKLEDDLDRDEAARKLALLQIEMATLDALESFRTLVDERTLLQEFERREDVAGSAKKTNKAQDQTWVIDSQPLGKDLVSKSGKILRPFVITSSKRRQILDGVFKPHWNLPTMSVDEYLELEKERGNIIEGGGVVPPEEKSIMEEALEDDHDIAAQDAETAKLREWDAFKDDNPKGWGNRGGNRG